ncbi:hypothetical protein DXG01_004010 [Tephrocybe rancida]|nr:hypothetical protein DXG01_004010 [Tephrocybe rancida]
MKALRLPIEIIDLITHAIVDDPDREHTTLRSYALVSRRQAAPAQKALFAKISIDDKPALIRLGRLLQSNPHLFTYIQKFRIGDLGAMVESEEVLASILKATSKLRSLALLDDPDREFETATSFFEFSSTLTCAFNDVLQSPALVSLRVHYVVGLPLTFILSCRQLKELKLRTMYHHTENSHLFGFESDMNPPDSPSCALEVLKVNCQRCAQSIVRLSSAQHPLRAFTAEELHPTTFRALISQSYHSLRNLKIVECEMDAICRSLLIYRSSFQYSYAFKAVSNVDFPKLEVLQIEFTYQKSYPNREWTIEFITSLLESNRTMTGLCPLKFVTLSFKDRADSNPSEDLLKIPFWSRLDATLSQPRYAGFAKLNIEIWFRVAQVDVDSWRQFQARFAFLFAAEKIELEWMNFHMPTQWPHVPFIDQIDQ